MTTTSTPAVDEPRCFLSCLQCYNEGRLIGDWYAATEAAEVTTSQLHGRPIPENTHEELWCLDIDNIPMDREMSPHEAGQWGEVYEELDSPEQWPALCAWVRSGSYVAQCDTDLPCVGDFQERYAGQWPSFRDYAFQLAEDIDLFDGLDEDSVVVRYFDWDSWIRDLAMDYSVESDGQGGVFIFRIF